MDANAVQYGYAWESDMEPCLYHMGDIGHNETHDLYEALVLGIKMRMRIQPPEGWHWRTVQRYPNHPQANFWHGAGAV